ncbi:uncharacterized protein Dwil_GK21102 [Drosophila willistoni]|uniref:Uncharacterized protein n=1 Tax=Drosophila willistoni TaxID=7260 RepID=B4N7A6_DROWI|nr:keratin, type I cytoskeletal 9 [Drosophila willistoni]EDW80247.2 uncharacterized protein Dwil_GK21102 [Drosophila willistoni]
MENGNYNSAEFGWEYGAGAGGQPQGQMQMNQGGRGQGGYSGQQWLHSNQGNTYNYQQRAMSQNGRNGGMGAESSPFSSYNDAMMQAYTDFGGKDMFSMQGESINMGSMDSGMSGNAMAMGMGGGSSTRNGLGGGNPRNGMGGGNAQRSYGGYSNNGLDNPRQQYGQGQSQNQGWF